ncbi:dUTP diphosphatase [Halioglobus sp. HI00S01]|uniref:dUTP diphosphatase n=1 Tax=Halioglobus sp. HI00S01 TaxID=1822214 RepID=UPI000AB8531E|nr:dUTP diphosphatase [Halioglobus sp. HI00S01]
MVKFKRLGGHERPIPKRGSEHAAGFDLQAAHAAEIPPGGRCLIKTGFAVRLPDGHYGRIAPRSGLALKHGLDVMAGVIDIDYIGDIGVLLYNTTADPFEIGEGDRIAQLIVERCSYMDAEEVADLEDTTRGADGYGSTGV